MDGDAARPPRVKLIELVEQVLARKSAARSVSADDPLTEIGVDSLSMVNLMLAIEAEFDIMIAPADITPENLRSVESIEALITRRAAAATAPPA
jgi:acyl carrier protein